MAKKPNHLILIVKLVAKQGLLECWVSLQLILFKNNIIHFILIINVYFTVAVVVTFFLCWAPFHAQRIMAIYGKIMQKSIMTNELFLNVYAVLTYISGILYFLSTCINPFLYNIMSHKFRNASKVIIIVFLCLIDLFFMIIITLIIIIIFIASIL